MNTNGASSGGASVAVGLDASTGGSSSNANAGSYDTAIGSTAKVTQRNAAGVPTNSSNSSAVGYGAAVSGTGSNAFGNAATVDAGSGTALGHVSSVLADNGTAVCATAQVTANGARAVALGALEFPGFRTLENCRSVQFDAAMYYSIFDFLIRRLYIARRGEVAPIE
ncbi:hypothetical protein [Burkholderia cepacia]|uniref:hypothetical protein n=1 Tax=Burkholderia cepacia TaxID=292 RepID=UPI0012D88087|nr:hypothetical protein [Burkholderia cepacia]